MQQRIRSQYNVETGGEEVTWDISKWWEDQRQAVQLRAFTLFSIFHTRERSRNKQSCYSFFLFFNLSRNIEKLVLWKFMQLAYNQTVFKLFNVPSMFLFDIKSVGKRRNTQTIILLCWVPRAQFCRIDEV